MSIRRWTAHALVGAALTVGCGSSGPPGAPDAGAPCPSSAPSDGDPCTSAYLGCVYEYCATDGVVRATCTPADGGAARWSVAATPCGACSGRVCAAGTVCAQRIAGALLVDCVTHTCGEGPLDCICACGAGVACTLGASSGDGAVFGCYVGCGAAICP